MILNLLNSKYKGNSIIYGLYWSVFYELKDFKKSAINFSKVIAIKPKSELASLGLFHSLLHLGKDRKALQELFRFTDIEKPKLHIETIQLVMKSIDTIGFKTDRKKIKNVYEKWGNKWYDSSIRYCLCLK